MWHICGERATLKVYRHFRSGMERFAEPDEYEWICDQCGEVDADEVVDYLPDEECDDAEFTD